jgi:hypothetical protein
MFNYGNMSLSKYLTEYFSDEESGAISDSEGKLTIYRSYMY